MTKTLDYYNQNAAKFAESTVNVTFTDTPDRFLNKLNENPVVLDFGCGAGRDTKYFLDHGCDVTATDGSEELCRIASELTGIEVKQMLFQELSDIDKYDGIWACSSILHLPKDELKAVMIKMRDALKDNGIIYTSFKYSEFEGFRNGRYFTDFTSEKYHEFMKDIDHLETEEEWISSDVRPGRGDEKWLNVIIRKK